MTDNYEHQLSVDELPKHSNELAGYAIANPPYERFILAHLIPKLAQSLR